jgi:hypothetical protein
MIVQVQNENYGYRVATFGDYVAVANPFITRWSPASASIICTGSVEYYRYNKATDEHDLVGRIYREWGNMPVLLTTEAAGSVSASCPLHTEVSGTVARTDNLNIEIDKDRYTASFEDGFGLAMDMHGTLLAVGSPYFDQVVQTQAITLSWTGSVVNIFDLAKSQYLTQNPFAFSQDQQVFVAAIYDPDSGSISESFGQGVSINDEWLAVGSPLVSGSTGMVYMFQNTSTGSGDYEWQLYQKIELTGSIPEAMFGADLKLNKGSGSFAPDMVVGCGNILNAQAYYFSFISGSWVHTYTLNPIRDIYPLTFGGYTPYDPVMNYSNGFGTAVSIFNDTIVVGAPYDRMVYEYSGSTQYQQGATYVFERCPGEASTLWKLVLKTYGNSNILKNNLMGYAVDIYGDYIISGIPKTNIEETSCLLASTIEQSQQCDSDLERTLIGQFALLQRNTQSGEWGILNIYQKKKEFLNTYKDFGYDVSIADKALVVGAPMLIIDSNRLFNVNVTASGDIVKLGDISGKAYIYNLNNLQNQFHVGNVFYRNGKIILMTSGSIFDGVFFNPITPSTYEYDIMFRAQHTIFEKQVVCSVNTGEFNVSTNPTAIIRASCSLDVNGNGIFDFQDVDVLLRYMQYKNTTILGLPVSTDWSSSIVTSNDEMSLLRFYQYDSTYKATYTSYLASESIVRWELDDTGMQTTLDLNQDNRIDTRDMNILWKYFTNRLTQANYSTYITPACHRKLFSDIIDYMNKITQKNAQPYIKPMFSQYESLTSLDKTGSFLAPMVTTIGLYSGLDLVAVAKLGSPIKITPELPINFVVKMDF